MRWSLGTAVFSGMLGVTLFGVLLTPVFFYVIESLGKIDFFQLAVVRWVFAMCAGLFLGLAAGFLVWKVGFPHQHWALTGGAILGLLAALAAQKGYRRRNKS
jgi:multidrug efflux pump